MSAMACTGRVDGLFRTIFGQSLWSARNAPRVRPMSLTDVSPAGRCLSASGGGPAGQRAAKWTDHRFDNDRLEQGTSPHAAAGAWSARGNTGAAFGDRPTTSMNALRTAVTSDGRVMGPRWDQEDGPPSRSGLTRPRGWRAGIGAKALDATTCPRGITERIGRIARRKK